MQMRAYSSWSKDFWSELGKKSLKKNKFNISTPLDVYKSEFLKNANMTLYTNVLDKKNLYNLSSNNKYESVDKFDNDVFGFSSLGLTDTLLNLKKGNLLETGKVQAFSKDFLFVGSGDDKIFKTDIFKKTQPVGEKKSKPELSTLHRNVTKTWSVSETESYNNFFEKEILNNYNFTKSTVQHPDLDDETRTLKRSSGKNTPLRLLKCPNSDSFFKDSLSSTTDIELLRFRFNEQKSTIANKPVRPTIYLTFKQKRYNQRTNIGKKTQIFFDRDLNKNQTYSGNPFLKDASIIEENFGNPTRQYRMVKKAKSRLDTTKVSTWNRLLRSRRVLVLPAHVNITVITNSFDVVHSWHIPGLGLKMDCLPGRATHHTMYIDNVGLYYGQCAEICGRYHHHMPIRVCALPFEHFLVWWHTFGLPKFLFPSDKGKVNIPVNKYFARKFSW